MILAAAILLSAAIVAAVWYAARLWADEREEAAVLATAQREVRLAEERIGPRESPIPCPKCSSTRPQASVGILRQWVRRDGQLVSLVSGDRVWCQECGHVYGVSASGTFTLHDSVLARGGQPAPEPPHREGAPPQRPTPKDRPRV